jgi:hypothetical protein
MVHLSTATSKLQGFICFSIHPFTVRWLFAMDAPSLGYFYPLKYPLLKVEWDGGD